MNGSVGAFGRIDLKSCVCVCAEKMHVTISVVIMLHVFLFLFGFNLLISLFKSSLNVNNSDV